MKIYLYTENFEKERFDLYQFATDGLRRIEPKDDDYSRIMSEASDLECNKDPDESGVAAVGGVYGFRNKTYVAFKVLINEVAPCGRKRLIFGFTEPVWRYGDLEVRRAFELLMQECSISMPEDRLTLLERCIEEARKMSRRRLFRRWKAVPAAAIAESMRISLRAKKQRMLSKEDRNEQ